MTLKEMKLKVVIVSEEKYKFVVEDLNGNIINDRFSESFYRRDNAFWIDRGHINSLIEQLKQSSLLNIVQIEDELENVIR